MFRAWCGKPSVCLPPTPPLPPGVQRTDSRAGHPSSQLVGDRSGGAAVRDMGSTNGLVGRPRNPESPSGNGLKLSPGPGGGAVTERVQGLMRVTVLGQPPSAAHNSGVLSTGTDGELSPAHRPLLQGGSTSCLGNAPQSPRAASPCGLVPPGAGCPPAAAGPAAGRLGHHL